MNGFVFMVMWSAISLAVSWLRGPQAFPIPSWFIPNLKPMMIQWQHFEAVRTGTVEKRSLWITERDLKNRRMRESSPQLSQMFTFIHQKSMSRCFIISITGQWSPINRSWNLKPCWFSTWHQIKDWFTCCHAFWGSTSWYACKYNMSD